jgi:myo-inositol-1(or 4)-monophosphatase
MDTARRCVELAARWTERRMRRSFRVREKSPGDLVTDLDEELEARLRRELHRAWPAHGFVGEEGGSSGAGAELVWLVDPIDGTSNLAAGLPIFGISVCCLRRGVPLAGAIHCFPERATYFAGAGLGCYRGGRRIEIPRRAKLTARAIVGVQWKRGGRNLSFLAPVLRTGARVRILGSTVVQVCDVLTGRLDANLQEQGRPWDIAACGLLVAEAGGEFTRWDGSPIFPLAPSARGHSPSLAAGRSIHRHLRSLLRLQRE